MQRIPIILALCAVLFTAGGCGGNSQDESASHSGSDSQEAIVTFELNDGQKWDVDEHTRGAVEAMGQLMAGTETLGSVDEAHTLGEGFSRELASLVQGCTMTGPAHDQLHVFLAAMFPRVAKLKSQTELAEAQVLRDEIGSVFDAYGAAFN